jgi:probable F420-dependent oxidoreductase
MQIGVSFPVTEVAGDPDDIRAFVLAVANAGYRHLLAPDHVVKCPHDGREPKLTGPYTEKDSFHDPFVLFSFVAALSPTLEFVTGVLVLPQRQTALVAQQAADVDLLSRERLRLGVGIGWNYVEFDALGMNFKTRARRVEEQVGLLRQLWADPVISFEGEFDRIDRAGINPRPRRQIPIWLGGHSEAAYARGAQLGDGFIFAAPGKAAVEAWQSTRGHLDRLGRSEEGFGRELLAIFARNAQEAADHILTWRDGGGTHASVQSMGLGLGADIRAHIDYVSEVRRLIEAG